MQVRSLGQEDPQEKEMATHSSILAWEIPWTEGLGRLHPWDHKESDTIERLNHLKAIENDGIELPWQLSGYDFASIAAGVNSIPGQKTHTA